MNIPERETKEQKYTRLRALFDLCGQRYSNAGGDPNKSASCNVYLTEPEQQEFFALARALSKKG
jgi:hypothetical protein